MKVKLFVFLVLLILTLVFVYQNSAPVPVQFFKWEYPVPFALLLFSLLATGVLLGALMVTLRHSRNKKKKAETESRLKQEQAPTPAADTGPGVHSAEVEPESLSGATAVGQYSQHVTGEKP